MPSPEFRFKQFTIRHDRSAMKVGTDGVLLGSWAAKDIQYCPKKILDVGTGTGLIALMMAQRFEEALIDGFDIDISSIEQAKENAESSPWGKRIHIWKRDFSDINDYNNKYQIIVSNPPFYQETTLGGNEARDAARHTHSLSFETLVEKVSQLLDEHGVFTVIIPWQSAQDFIGICIQKHLYLSRRLDIKSTERKPFKRVMLEFCHHMCASEYDTLTLYDKNNQRSTNYSQLTQDFYL